MRSKETTVCQKRKSHRPFRTSQIFAPTHATPTSVPSAASPLWHGPSKPTVAGRAVLIDRHGVIIAGNKTVEQARRLNLPLHVVKTDGQHLIAVQREDLDLRRDPRARALAVADNRVGELDLEWNVEMLKHLREDGLDLSAFWTDVEFANLFDEAAGGLTDDDLAVEPAATNIARGDLFVLGKHRLLCGDATSPVDVERVLDGARPMLMPTDPPYGIEYQPGWRHRVNPSQRTAVGTVLNDDRADWTPAWRLFPGAITYVWHAALKAGIVAASLEAAAFSIRSQIIWAKQHFAMSRGQYHWQHEPAWYAVKKGASGHWCGDRAQTTVWEVPNLNPMGGARTPENPITGHGTQKPVRLFEIPIRNHTIEGDGVYDPFCGTGTAIIAAEKLRRRCYSLDLDPRYVQAAVTRWERYSGKRAEVHRATPPTRRRAR